ncbi:hypothetical protein PV10_08257 [Exophiala mesophila]|uniref:Uncharacterized protein n=1 Tax=Exophiala mesophila TaxID=212818 RepID=A0A0D1Z1E4_EXOME|nr:uncharacterized protein PV10_08257 [Exophiala mesophila]KIV88587.1 hypothetical protein PV10_08257 [Exophiala mesophila]
MDPDETMTSSTESSPSLPGPSRDVGDLDEDDSLFPVEDPQTPANNHLNAAAPGELSPPRSQPQSDDSIPQVTVPNGNNPQANMTATRQSARPQNTNQVSQEPREEPGASGERDERPGWGWSNKKAQEEMQRAWDNIVDRDFSLTEYGDVVLLRNALATRT